MDIQFEAGICGRVLGPERTAPRRPITASPSLLNRYSILSASAGGVKDANDLVELE
jgi:hypothetical protein